MVQRNENIAKLVAGYLFPEINRRKNLLLKEQPDAKLISLGIGNTTEPLTPHIVKGLESYSKGLGTKEGYSGYGDEIGNGPLRTKIASKIYNDMVAPDEVIISDGAKCDIGRLQMLFGAKTTLAVQDPAYPVYVDGSVMMGQTGNYNAETKSFEGIVYMECKPESDFFPDLAKLPKTDLIYFCSPNNPTGAVATRAQLEALVKFAQKNNSIIIFDSAYAMYIKDDSLPKSIYEIEGAKSCAIEVSSFSKMSGFTGVRLGWTVVPNEVKFSDGTPVKNDWIRLVNTIFNGASNIAQAGGMAALDEQGWKEMEDLVNFYMENAKIIKTTLEAKGIKCYGGANAPYIWAHFPNQDSWEVFEKILRTAHIVTTPGAGFGAAGNGFIRFSAFGNRNNILEAVERIKKLEGLFDSTNLSTANA